MSSSPSKNEIDRYHLLHEEIYRLNPNIKKIKEYLNKGANINKKGFSSFRPAPLHLAVNRGHVNVVRLLIKRGAKVNIMDKYNKTPLHRAYEYEEFSEQPIKAQKMIRLLTNYEGVVRNNAKKSTRNITRTLAHPNVGFSPAVASLIALRSLPKNQREIAKRLMKKR